MKYSDIDFCGYDTLIQPTEWRYSATILGLVKYLDFCKKYGVTYQYLANMDTKPAEYVKGFDGLLYNQADITEERFLEFVEFYFKNDMTHLKIEEILKSEELTDEQLKMIDDRIKSKTILKKLLKSVKVEDMQEVIDSNRTEIIKSIFRYGKNMYGCYCNSNLLLSDVNQHCRLVGYSVDEGRKSNSLGFCFAKDSFVSSDIPEFDFIPFAFSNSDMFETYFINNNYSIEMLVLTNNTLAEKLVDEKSLFTGDKSREKLLSVLKEAKSFIEYDVEIITKSRDNDYYETLFVRSRNLEQLQKMEGTKLKFSYMYDKDRWINLEKEVYERCLNEVLLDDLILFMLKLYNEDKVSTSLVAYKTQKLIEVNASWKVAMYMAEEKIMTDIQLAKNTGFYAAQKLIEMNRKNKVDSYRQKIISALTAHDYDRVKEVILSLSAYVGMEFSFFYKLLENAEENIDLAFAFASALNTDNNNNKDKEQ